jgi:hypothetical protein
MLISGCARLYLHWVGNKIMQISSCCARRGIFVKCWASGIDIETPTRLPRTKPRRPRPGLELMIASGSLNARLNNFDDTFSCYLIKLNENAWSLSYIVRRSGRGECELRSRKSRKDESKGRPANAT